MMKMKKYILTKITGILLIAGCLCLMSSYGHASSCGGSSCGNSTCSLSTGAGGALPTKCPSGTRYDVDPNCIMNQNAAAGSCIDTMPVASINRVSETNCYRANGAGGNPTPRNHLGTDYAASSGTTVTAAADGTIVHAAPMNGGGRTIIIEHEKVCQCSAGNPGGGCDSKYITVYMHLSNFFVTGGSVKKGQPIGTVGGSNYKNGKLCDYPDANTSDSCKPYGPHLHFEIHSGPYSKGYAALKSSIINPLCDDIQQFCGGCSYDVQQCQNKNGAQDWEKLGDEAAKEKQQAAATGQTTAPVSYGESSGNGGGETKDCSLERFMPQGDTCWFCPMFKVLFNTASVIAKKAYEALAKSIATVVLVMFAIWVSVYILKHVAAVEVKDPRKMLQELMLQAFKVLIVVLILRTGFFQVVQLTLEPVFNTGMTFVQAITDVGNESACSPSAEYMQNIKGYDSTSGYTENASGGLPTSMGKNILCSMKSMQDSVAKMMAYGKQAWCVAWGPKAWLFNLLPNFGFLITGIVIFLGGFILLLAFPWCLVDCVLQMSVAAALAPAAIGAWAFKMTKQHLKTIWDLFMNAMFNFVFLSIILYIIMVVVDQFMRRLDQYANETTGWDFLIHPINGLAYWGVTGTQLVVICLMGWVFLDEGKKFADKFAKGGPVQVGRSVGAMAAQAGTKAGKAAFSAGKTLGSAAMQVGDHFVGSKVRQLRNDYRINKVKNGADNVLRDEKGNITGYERTRRNLFGKKVTRRVMVNEDGKEVWSKEKHSRAAEIGNFLNKKVNQARHELMFNRDRDENGNLVNAKDILDDEGNLIARETEHGKVFYDKDGNETAREHYHRNLMGRKVTTKEELGADGNWKMSRTKNSVRMEILSKLAPDGSKLQQFAKNNIVAKERDLDKQNLSSKVISSDKFMSIRQIKDNNGVVRQEDIAFNTKTIKHLVNSKGEINTAMVQAIMRESTFDQKTVFKAIAMEVAKTRGIEINNKFMDRTVTFDDKGNMVLNQKNMDGSSTILKVSYGGPNGNQMYTEAIDIDSKGVVQKISKNNGIQKAEITTDHTGKQTAQYGFTDEYMRRYKYTKPLNRYGKFADTLDANAATFGFSDYDHNLHVQQVATGKNQKYAPPREDSRDVPPTPEKSIPTHQDGRTATMNDPIRHTEVHENGGKTVTANYVDPNGWVSENKDVYDAQGRLNETHYKNDQGAKYDSKIEYDDVNRTSVKSEVWTDKDGKTTTAKTFREHDANGNVISERTIDDNGKPVQDADDSSRNQQHQETPEEKAKREAQEKTEREAREKAEREAREKAENRNVIETEIVNGLNGETYEITKDKNGVVLNMKVKKAGENNFTVLEQRTTHANGNISSELVRNTANNSIVNVKYDVTGKETERHMIEHNSNGEKIFEQTTKNGVKVHEYMKSENGHFVEKIYDDEGRTLAERLTLKGLNGQVDGTVERQFHENGKLAIEEEVFNDGTRIYKSNDENGNMIEKTISKPGYLNKQVHHEDGRFETILENQHGKIHTIALNGSEILTIHEDDKGVVEHREQTETGKFRIHRDTQDENKFYRHDYNLDGKVVSDSVLDKDGREIEKTEFNSSGWKTKHTKHLDNGYTEVTVYTLNEQRQTTVLYDKDGKPVS